MAKRHDIEKVIAIGEDLFRRKGFHNMGTDELLTAAEYPRSSFYHHFGSKEGFALRVILGYGQRMLAEMKASLEDPENGWPISRLRQYFFAQTEKGAATGYAQSCLLFRFSMDIGSEAGNLKEAVQSELGQWFEVTAACVAEAQREEELRKDMRADEITKMLFGALWGGFSIARISGKPKDYDAVMEGIFNLITA